MSRDWHFWISANDHGKPYLIYGCPAKEGEEAARMRGFELLPGIDFEIKRLPTRDIGTASSMIRGKRLEETHSLKKASRRIGHQRSIENLRKRYTKHDDWTI